MSLQMIESVPISEITMPFAFDFRFYTATQKWSILLVGPGISARSRRRRRETERPEWKFAYYKLRRDIAGAKCFAQSLAEDYTSGKSAPLSTFVLALEFHRPHKICKLLNVGASWPHHSRLSMFCVLHRRAHLHRTHMRAHASIHAALDATTEILWFVKPLRHKTHSRMWTELGAQSILNYFIY